VDIGHSFSVELDEFCYLGDMLVMRMLWWPTEYILWLI